MSIFQFCGVCYDFCFGCSVGFVFVVVLILWYHNDYLLFFCLFFVCVEQSTVLLANRVFFGVMLVQS